MNYIMILAYSSSISSYGHLRLGISQNRDLDHDRINGVNFAILFLVLAAKFSGSMNFLSFILREFLPFF
jgi:hypothetical protein